MKTNNKLNIFSSLACWQASAGFDPLLSTECVNNNLSLVIWGSNLISTVEARFTLKQSAMVQLAPYQYGVIIGLMLSDGWITLSTKYSKNARIGFKQSADHASYVWFVFNLLSHYCGSYPQLTTGVRLGKRYYGLQFFTRAMPCITELYYLFYPKGVKTIPHNIYEILTPIALALWIMGDVVAKKKQD